MTKPLTKTVQPVPEENQSHKGAGMLLRASGVGETPTSAALSISASHHVSSSRRMG